ncbi:MAG: hypothetical protein IJ131_07175, partial [Eggerthellaceae bacterium]|nr:hypothetical protein [Eggerthellaceae bacterium]
PFVLCFGGFGEKHMVLPHRNRGEMAMFYRIEERLTVLPEESVPERGQYVAVLTPSEWARRQGRFDMGIDIEADLEAAMDMQAEVNYDSVTGVIRVPDRSDLSEDGVWFSFALDEKGIVFIDGTGTAERMVSALAAKRWRKPGIERLLYDFLMLLVEGDTAFMKRVEEELDRMERGIYADEKDAASPERVNEIRNDMRDLDDYLEHLQDFASVLEENENGFFEEENLRYFRLFYNRVEKLRDKAASLREQAMQMRDLYKMHLDIRQNRIMTVLTVVTAIFAPLTLIVGWYGMNFVYMPELALPYAYPALICVFVVLIVALVVFFRKIRWL